MSLDRDTGPYTGPYGSLDRDTAQSISPSPQDRAKTGQRRRDTARASPGPPRGDTPRSQGSPPGAPSLHNDDDELRAAPAVTTRRAVEGGKGGLKEVLEELGLDKYGDLLQKEEVHEA